MRSNQKQPNIWRGILVGLIAGLAASWTMDRFQDVWIAVSPRNRQPPIQLRLRSMRWPLISCLEQLRKESGACCVDSVKAFAATEKNEDRISLRSLGTIESAASLLGILCGQ